MAARTSGTDTTRTTMKVIQQTRYGTPEVLEFGEVEVPVPDENRVLVRVRASSVNAYDWHMTTGTPHLARIEGGFRRPKKQIPGSDVAGIVEAIGPEVTQFRVGDEVFGAAGAGAWAEYVRVRETNLTHKPSNVSFEQVAAVPMAAITALEGLRDHGHLEPGQKVLINGAGGGVGTFAVQLARIMGADVTAVSSHRNLEQSLALGATRVIDYEKEKITDNGERYDLMLDVAGLGPVSECKKVLKPVGRYVVVSGPKHRVLGPVRRVVWAALSFVASNKSMKVFVAGNSQEDLKFLGELLASGELVSVVEKTYDFADTPRALAYLGTNHARAKLVITL